MDDPVPCRLLSYALLHEGLLGTEELHGEFVVGGLEECLQLVAQEPLCGRTSVSCLYLKWTCTDTWMDCVLSSSTIRSPQSGRGFGTLVELDVILFTRIRRCLWRFWCTRAIYHQQQP